MTLNDLYRRTLEELTVTSAGEEADASDTQVIASTYEAVYDQLASLDLVSWAESQEVPERAVLPLVWMLAFAAAKKFGKDPANWVATGSINAPTLSLGERQLRQQMARAYVSAPAQSEYY
jgi:hypothetical protein